MARGSATEVLLAFLKLGLTSFGGPAAHLGYFRTEFVERRKWLDDGQYSDLVALSQFLPGPASSKVGISLGLGRAGWLGALAAWTGFTLPSALALVLFAMGVTHRADLASSGAIHGLKVAAVAVVAQAVWGMSRSLCPDRTRAAIAAMAALVVLTVPTASGQIGAILIGAAAGRWFVRSDGLRHAGTMDHGVSRRSGAILLSAYGALLVILPAVAVQSDSLVLQAMAAFYKAGALVFGGGHVVLPLLESEVVGRGWVDLQRFLAGYGAAQAVPGPLFTVAAYVGAVMPAPLGSWAGAAVGLTFIFLPAFLLTPGALPFWVALRRHEAVRRALAGVNAAVVGILAGALYDPVWTSAILSIADAGLALAAFGALVYGRVSPAWVVAGTAVAGWLLGRL